MRHIRRMVGMKKYGMRMEKTTEYMKQGYLQRPVANRDIVPIMNKYCEKMDRRTN